MIFPPLLVLLFQKAFALVSNVKPFSFSASNLYFAISVISVSREAMQSSKSFFPYALTQSHQ